jgi:hypothetical protein
VNSLLKNATDSLNYLSSFSIVTSNSEQQQIEQFAAETSTWFELDSIRAREKWIADLLIRSKEDIICEQDDFMTFLTQRVKESQDKDRQQLV